MADDGASARPDKKRVEPRPFPYPYGSDLHWLWGWGERIRCRVDDDLPVSTLERWNFMPDSDARDAMMRFSVRYPLVIKQIDEYLDFAEAQYKTFLERKDEESTIVFLEAIERLQQRIEVGSETIAQAEATQSPIEKQSSVATRQGIPIDAVFALGDLGAQGNEGALRQLAQIGIGVDGAPLPEPIRMEARDAWGVRTLVIPANEVRLQCGYEKPGSERTILELESRTGTRLRDGENPLWFLRLHSQFVEQADHNSGISFAAHCARVHADKIEIRPTVISEPREIQVDANSRVACRNILAAGYLRRDRLIRQRERRGIEDWGDDAHRFEDFYLTAKKWISEATIDDEGAFESLVENYRHPRKSKAHAALAELDAKGRASELLRFMWKYHPNETQELGFPKIEGCEEASQLGPEPSGIINAETNPWTNSTGRGNHPEQHVRIKIAKEAIDHAIATLDAEAGKLLAIAEVEGKSGFVILTAGEPLKLPVSLEQLAGRVWCGKYKQDKLDETLYFANEDERLQAFIKAHNTVVNRRLDFDRLKLPIRPRPWRGESPGDIDSLKQLRSYVNYVLSLEGERNRNTFPLANALLNVDNALVVWEVAGAPEVSPEPRSEDEARRALLRRLQWLNEKTSEPQDYRESSRTADDASHADAQTSAAQRSRGAKLREKPKPAAMKAWRSHEYAAQKLQNPKLTDQEIFDWLHEHGTSDGKCGLDDYELPNFETWRRQLSEARRLTETNKYGRRQNGAFGRSVVSWKEI